MSNIIAPSTPRSTSRSETELQKQYNAYFYAGYDDAMALAKLWKSADEPGAIKAEAGRRLLAGETLPMKL